MPQTLVLICCIFSLGLAVFQPSFIKKKESSFYFSPSKNIKYFSLGFQEISADILWMRLLQNIDFCNSKKGLPIYDGSKLYKCEKGWSYKMTDAITELAPKFKAPYSIAASIMSVVMRDKIGAKKIYDKALKNYPKDWKLHFSASYHYLIELEDETRAIPLLIKTADLGGPFWLYGLAAQTQKKRGRLQLAENILKNALKNTRSKAYKKTFEFRLKKVQKEIQKLDKKTKRRKILNKKERDLKL